MLKHHSLRFYEAGVRLAIIRHLFEVMETETEELFVGHMVALEGCVKRLLPDARYSERGPLITPFKDWTEKQLDVRVRELNALKVVFSRIAERLPFGSGTCRDILTLGLKIGIAAVNGDLVWSGDVNCLLKQLDLERADVVPDLINHAEESSKALSLDHAEELRKARSLYIVESLLRTGTTDEVEAVLEGIQRMHRSADTVTRPVWNRQTMELMIAGRRVRKVARQATNIMVILDSFQERGWPYEMALPTFKDDVEPDRSTVDSTLTSLNRSLESKALGSPKFGTRTSSDGQVAIYWELRRADDTRSGS
ncbi:MAG: hypothetical protein HQ518_17670 [Rhodopirellula sp.]|nr:hypothetical protein [Rhodopirellula sp.]